MIARFLIFAIALGPGAFAGAPPASIPAFPGAEGAGMFTSGGRGGTVVHVTNLNAAGPGSFADAVSGPDRIVVFDVYGIIELADASAKKEGKKSSGRIAIEYPNITVAG